jgi:hypothetical protein
MNKGDRICLLTSHFKRIRVDWQKSKSVMARELQALMTETNEISPENAKSIFLKGVPIPYDKIYFGF